MITPSKQPSKHERLVSLDMQRGTCELLLHSASRPASRPHHVLFFCRPFHVVAFFNFTLFTAGLTIGLMVFADEIGGAFPHLNHSPWDTTTFADYVMPWFLFMVGTSMVSHL